MSQRPPRGSARSRRRASKRIPRNRKRPNYLRLFCWFIISAVVSGAAAYTLCTPNLDVQDIQIYGVRLADRSAVEKAAKPALGHNIILLRKSPVLSRIARLTEVRQVKMGRRFPNKVWIRVWERKADAVLTDTRSYCMVQDDGFMFHAVNSPVEGVPLIEVAKCGSLKPGRISSSPVVLQALDVLKCARKEEIKTAKISVDDRGDLCLNMGSDFYVKLGQPDETARKMSLLRRALIYKPSIAKQALYIDLSCPSAPVWKPKVMASSAR